MLGRWLLMMNIWWLVLPQVSASCPKDCRCLPDTPRCAAGVSLMIDGCGCCKVCARQLFEDCSKTQPCDHTKGLECNFGGVYGSAKGICRGIWWLQFLFGWWLLSLFSSYFEPHNFVCFSNSQIRRKNVWVQQQDLPEWGNLPSKLQTPVHLHGRRCWMRLPLPARAHAAKAGVRQAQAGQGTRTVLRAARLPRGRKDRELCDEETQEKAQQRQQAVWGRPHQQEWVGSCVERTVFTWWAAWNNAGNVWISSCCISSLFPLKCSNP